MLPKEPNRLSNVLVKLSKILYTVKNNKVKMFLNKIRYKELEENSNSAVKEL